MTKPILRALALGSLASGVIAIVTVSAPMTGAQAEIALPYCLSGGGGLYDNCNYATFAQCQTSAASFGVCSPNPKYAPKAVQLSIRNVASPAGDDLCRMSRPENERGFVLTERYFM